jgi:hypothetical protein
MRQEIFDEVTEEMVSSEWNYDLQELQEFIQQLIQTAMQIQSFEQLISKVSTPLPPCPSPHHCVAVL